jgi:NIPSNAP
MTPGLMANLTMRSRRRWNGWMVCGIALVAFGAGSLLTARLMQPRQVPGDSRRVFELRVYHAVPGKVPALESRFRDASKLLAKHNLNVIGYWVSDDDAAWANTFIYLVAHPSRGEAKRNWDAFHADPLFQEYVKSEEVSQLIENVDKVYMRPTDFSLVK